MKPNDWVALIAAVNNGWAFAAFVIVVIVTVYFSRRDAHEDETICADRASKTSEGRTIWQTLSKQLRTSIKASGIRF